MPLYEYECTECGEVMEELHSMSSKPKIKCETCDSRCVKIVSRPIVHRSEATKSVYYKMERAIKKGKAERFEAERASHMGTTPYSDMQIDAPDIVDNISQI